MPPELDEFGIPVKKKRLNDVDDFGIPLKKKDGGVLAGVLSALPSPSQSPSSVKQEPEAIEDYNKRFEEVTGHKDFSLSEPTKPKGLLGQDLYEKRKKSFEEKKYLTNREREKEIVGVQNKVAMGTVKPEELSQLYEKPYGRKIVEETVNEASPETGGFGLSQEVFGHEKKWDEAAKQINIKNRPQGVEAQNQYYYNLDNELSNSINDAELEKTFVSGGTGGAGVSTSRSKLSGIDTNSAEQLGQVASQIENADTIIGKDGKGLDKNTLLKKINEKLMYLTSQKEIHPEIDGLSKSGKLSDALLRVNMKRERGEKITPLTDEVNQRQFELGLNYIKDAKPNIYKNVVRAINDKGEIAGLDYETISNIGQQIYNQQVFRGGASDPNLIGAETNIDYTSYDSKKAEYARIIGERAKQRGGKNRIEFSKDEIKKLGSDLPNQQIVNDLADEEQLLWYDAIPKSGWREAVAQGVTQPFSGIQSTLRTIGESPAETYLRSKKLDTGTGQKVADAKGNYSDILPSDRNNILYDMARGFGQFIPQVLLTKGIGGAVSKIASLEGRVGALSAEQLANVEVYGGTVASTYAQTYGDSYMDALQKTGDPATASLMGKINATASSLFETILPDVKIADKILKGGGLAKGIVDLIKKGGDPETLKTTAKGFVKKFVLNAADIERQEITEEVGTQVANYLTEAIFSPDTVKDRDLGEELVDTTKGTFISMLLPSLLGGGGMAMNKDFTRDGLHTAAINFADSQHSLEKSLANNSITQDEYDKSLALLGLHKDSVQNAPKIDNKGDLLSSDEKMNYAYQDTLSKVYTDGKNNTADEAEQEAFQKKLDRAEDNKDRILGGKKIVPEPEEKAVVTPEGIEPTNADVSTPIERSGGDGVEPQIKYKDNRPDVALNTEFLGKGIGEAIIKKEDGYYYHFNKVETKIPDQKRAENAFNESKKSQHEIEERLNAKANEQATPIEQETEKVEPYVEKYKRLMNENSETNKKRKHFLSNMKDMSPDEIKKLSDELDKESQNFVEGMNELSSRKKQVNETNQPTIEGNQSQSTKEKSDVDAEPPKDSQTAAEGTGIPPKPPKEEPVKDNGGKLNDKGILNRLYNAQRTPEAAKEGFKAEGLKYQTKDQEEAAGVAKAVVEEMGIDDAVLAAEAMKFDGDVNSLIFAEALNKLKEQEDAATTPEEKVAAAMKFAEVGITYDKMARYGGRFNAAINHFYKKSPLGIQLMENAKRKEDFDEWAKPKDKSWKEFFEEMIKEPEFEKIFKEHIGEAMKKERAENRKARIKKVDDFIDKAKDQFKSGATYATIIPPKVITAALEGIKKAYRAGEHVVKIVQDAIDYISKELGHDNWDKEKFRTEWEEKLKDKEGKKPLTDEELKLRILEKFRKKLKGLSESQKDDVIRRAHKQLIENGALEYDDFKKIIARVTGRADLTPEEAARMRSLVEKTNAVEDAAVKVRRERTDESFVELNIAEVEAGKAAKELNELFHNKPDITKRLTSIMQLLTLGIPALVNNPIYNVWNQAALRFPIGVVNDAIDRSMSFAATMAGKTYDQEYNVWETQGEFWRKLGLGTTEALRQLFTGLTRQDYLDKEVITQNQIRPFTAWRDLLSQSKRGRYLLKLMTGKEVQKKQLLAKKNNLDKIIQGTSGIPAEIVARTLNLGDKPQRFAAEGAQGAAFAKTLGLKDMDYKIFIKFPREEAYRNYKAQGLSDTVAGQKADYVKEAIIKEGQRSTFQQDNLLNDAITRAAGVLGGKDSGAAQLTKALVISPYIKIPSNAFWSLYNLLNPEIAILQAGVHAANSQRLNKKGELTKGKLQNREARYWLAHAIVGMGMRAAIIALVKAGVFVPGSDDDDSKKERDAASFYDKPGYVNTGGIKISNRWFGFMGMMGNAIAKKWKDATPEQREAQDDFWNVALGGMEWEALQELQNGVFANSSSLLQSLGSGDFSRYGLNTLNMFANIIQPASAAQFEKALVDEVPSSRGDSFLDKLNQSFAQRSVLYRKLFDVNIRGKRDIWGNKIPKGGNVLSRMFGISKNNPQLYARPVYEDYLKTQDSGFLPPTVEKDLNGKKLNTQQWDRLEMYVGNQREKLTTPYVSGMAEIPVTNKTYSQLKDEDGKPDYEQRKKVLQYLYSRGRTRGLKLFYKDFPEFRPKEKTPDEIVDDVIWDATKQVMKSKEPE